MGPDAVLVPAHGYYGRLCGTHPSRATADERAAARAEMRPDWAIHGPALTAWWMGEIEDVTPRSHFAPVERGGPGTRPWAWWEFSAQRGPRRGEIEADCLDEVRAWRPGERDRSLASG